MNASCLSQLGNQTVQTGFMQTYEETFEVIEGLNTIYLPNVTLFSKGSVVFYESNDTEITLSQVTSLNQTSDLIWDPNTKSLALIDTEAAYKFNFMIHISDFIYEDVIELSHVYLSSGVFNLSASIPELSFSDFKYAKIISGILNFNL